MKLKKRFLTAVLAALVAVMQVGAAPVFAAGAEGTAQEAATETVGRSEEEMTEAAQENIEKTADKSFTAEVSNEEIYEIAEDEILEEAAKTPELNMEEPVLYAVNLNDAFYGNVSFSDEELKDKRSADFAEGDVVKLDVTADKDCEIEQFLAMGEGAVLPYNDEPGGYSFKMPASEVNVYAFFRESIKEEVTDDEETEEWIARSKEEVDMMFGVVSEYSRLRSSDVVYGYISGNFYGGATASLSTGSGNLAFCILPWSRVPNGAGVVFNDYYVDASSNANHQLLAKIMYYGYGGAGNILGGYSAFDQEAITHFALSYVWMINMGNSYGLANPWRTGDSAVNGDGQALVMNFLNIVQGKEPVKGNLHLASFYTQSGSTYQDVAYGSFEPVVTEGYLKIHKQSTCTAVSKGNSHYDLSGAWYGVYKNAACTSADMVTSLQTDANGDTDVVKLQVGTYYVKEGTAPKGFKLDTNVYTVTVTTGNTANNPVVINSNDTPYNDPVYILVNKINSETGEGSESLEGAEYTVIYYDVDDVTKVEDLDEKSPFYGESWVFKTDNMGAIRFKESYKVSGPAIPSYLGINALPLGTLIIQEKKAPEGYEIDPTVYVFSIRMNAAGTGVEAYCHTTNEAAGISAGNVGDEGVTHKEKPIRANLKFVKVDETGSPMAGIPFEIESLTTGEKHTVTSDENGVVEVIPETAWFGGTAPDTKDGALIYDDYKITELPVAGNEGKDLVELILSFEDNNGKVAASAKTPEGVDIPVKIEGDTVKMLDLNEQPNFDILLGTTATDENKDTKTIIAKKDAKIVDVVSYDGLTPGRKYRVEGVLMDKSTGELFLVNGQEVRSSKEFTPKAKSGTVEVEFTFDTSSFKNETIVVFEDLYKGDTLLAMHHDIKDVDQTVYIPEIGTTAMDGNTGDHVGSVSETATIIDTVEYKGLTAGKEYTVKGTLMNKATGKALLVNGREVTASKTFTPDSKDGSVEITFTFDASALEGSTVVAFESIERGGIEVVVHADIKDKDQTVYYPEIGTTAVDKDTEDHMASVKGETTFIDTVEYKNLIPGNEYTVKGILMNVETGEPVVIDEAEVTGETTFTPEAAEGTVEVVFVFDATKLQGAMTVVFEELYHNDVKVAFHTELTDKDQTVIIPDIHTTALDGDTKEHTGVVGEKATIIDTVEYTNLIPGKEYAIKGILMNKKTGEPLLVNGDEVRAETIFTPEKSEGSVDVIFEFDSSALNGSSTVVFETIERDGIEIVTHAKIDDEDQTVDYPDIHTTAADKDTGDHVGTVGEKATIVDTVEYTNLIRGKEYKVKGVLMVKSTGKPLLVDGKEVTSETDFTPEAKDGSVEVIFEIDSSELKGESIVVFENLYREDIEIVTHADIKDEDQTVDYPKIGTKAGVNGQKETYASGTVTITDTVSYTNLIIGNEYTVKGILMDKATGKALLSGGKEVTSEVTFVALSKDGMIDVEFTFDASGLSEKTVVVFEDLYHNGVKVATHSNINDKEQAVFFKTPSTAPNTGDDNNSTGAAAMIAVAGAGAAVAIRALSKRKRERNV